VASFLFGTGCWIQTPAHPLLLVDVLHVSTAQVGVFAAAAAAATLVGGAWWGGLVDRRSSLDALWMMYLVGAATPAICALAWSPRAAPLYTPDHNEDDGGNPPRVHPGRWGVDARSGRGAHGPAPRVQRPGHQGAR